MVREWWERRLDSLSGSTVDAGDLNFGESLAMTLLLVITLTSLLLEYDDLLSATLT